VCKLPSIRVEPMFLPSLYSFFSSVSRPQQWSCANWRQLANFSCGQLFRHASTILYRSNEVAVRVLKCAYIAHHNYAQRARLECKERKVSGGQWKGWICNFLYLSRYFPTQSVTSFDQNNSKLLFWCVRFWVFNLLTCSSFFIDSVALKICRRRIKYEEMNMEKVRVVRGRANWVPKWASRWAYHFDTKFAPNCLTLPSQYPHISIFIALSTYSTYRFSYTRTFPVYFKSRFSRKFAISSLQVFTVTYYLRAIRRNFIKVIL